MSITLRPDTQRKIEERMKAGEYRSPDEVVEAALRLLDEQQHDEAAHLKEIRRKIAVGVEQLDRGEGVDGERAFDELLAGLNDTGAQSEKP